MRAGLINKPPEQIAHLSFRLEGRAVGDLGADIEMYAAFGLPVLAEF